MQTSHPLPKVPTMRRRWYRKFLAMPPPGMSEKEFQRRKAESRKLSPSDRILGFVVLVGSPVLLMPFYMGAFASGTLAVLVVFAFNAGLILIGLHWLSKSPKAGEPKKSRIPMVRRKQ